ncbi:MAG: oligosaccharide flippase family protein [Rhodospirillaceae bacterium]|nr:oligosaccharide flippase family protein [Rhodospirillaceae bacterium]MBT5013253.1 oligosaccharide flippase family protein [Rhodospirillaceae bacterium]MBT5309603.1 oligosaccharide flippase family protein [Rhodospirillaceae bacterium]MBT6406714.1 oligosaccharide flippase family protein [Rhodospirillaceae bacterium]MBT7356926.1 oligosaccharide flippase family protein [Rhodospirillaceae bacterium]
MPDGKFRLESKFLTDTAWNYGAFAVMAASGVILNFFIAVSFGVETLGVFNQIYAVYVISAQFAVMGFHDSAQKHTAELDDDTDRRDVVSAAAVALAVAFGFLAALVLYVLSGPIGRLFDSQPVGMGLALASPGLMFFAVNKVLMGVLNGIRRMRAFAVAQAFRVTAILVVCLAIGVMDKPGYMLGISFTIAEVLLLPMLLMMVRPKAEHFANGEEFKHWLKTHFNFGSRALINGFLAESYIRIDIVMLGIFMSDQHVGIYSFAALFVEGLYQLPVVVRTIANPVLVRLLGSGDKLETTRFCRRVAGMSGAIFVAVAAVVLLVYPYLGPYFPDDLVALSHPLLMVLAAGLAVYSIMIPLDHILLQAGQPGRQSLLMTVNVALNVILNLTLIPVFGLYGAAAATAIAFVTASLLVNAATWQWMGYRGGVLFAGTRWMPLR